MEQVSAFPQAFNTSCWCHKEIRAKRLETGTCSLTRLALKHAAMQHNLIQYPVAFAPNVCNNKIRVQHNLTKPFTLSTDQQRLNTVPPSMERNLGADMSDSIAEASKNAQKPVYTDSRCQVIICCTLPGCWSQLEISFSRHPPFCAGLNAVPDHVAATSIRLQAVGQGLFCRIQRALCSFVCQTDNDYLMACSE